MNIMKTLWMAALAAAAASAGSARAHCDGLDGPVVHAAQQALRTGNLNFALIWVQPADEAELKTAFDRAIAVRALNAETRSLADRYFFETLVRLHRAGEGAPYTGLKPAGRDLGPAIPAADKALETGSVGALQRLIAQAVEDGIGEQYARVSALKRYDPNDLAAGRAYVQAYVEFVHYVERLHEAATHGAEGHFAEGTAARP